MRHLSVTRIQYSVLQFLDKWKLIFSTNLCVMLALPDKASGKSLYSVTNNLCSIKNPYEFPDAGKAATDTKVLTTCCYSLNEPGTYATEIVFWTEWEYRLFKTHSRCLTIQCTVLHWLWLKSPFFKDDPAKLLGRRGRQKESTFNRSGVSHPQKRKCCVEQLQVGTFSDDIISKVKALCNWVKCCPIGPNFVPFTCIPDAAVYRW